VAGQARQPVAISPSEASPLDPNVDSYRTLASANQETEGTFRMRARLDSHGDLSRFRSGRR
jgi:hypothetical protein